MSRSSEKKLSDIAVSVHKEKYNNMCAIGDLGQLNIAKPKS